MSMLNIALMLIIGCFKMNFLWWNELYRIMSNFRNYSRLCKNVFAYSQPFLNILNGTPKLFMHHMAIILFNVDLYKAAFPNYFFYSFNPLTTNVPIIQKPVSWFALHLESFLPIKQKTPVHSKHKMESKTGVLPR